MAFDGDAVRGSRAVKAGYDTQEPGEDMGTRNGPPLLTYIFEPIGADVTLTFEGIGGTVIDQFSDTITAPQTVIGVKGAALASGVHSAVVTADSPFTVTLEANERGELPDGYAAVNPITLQAG